MVRVLVLAPEKLALFRCHWYVSVPASVLASTVNVTCDPGATFILSTGCWVISGGVTGSYKEVENNYDKQMTMKYILPHVLCNTQYMAVFIVEFMHW